MPLEVSVALIALGGVLVGAVLSIVGQMASDAISAHRAAKVRVEQRSDELWQMSQPAAERLHELFAVAIGMANASLFDDGMLPAPDFSDVYEPWWDKASLRLRTDAALIPDKQFRDAFETVELGLAHYHGLQAKAGYSFVDEYAVIDVASIGFEIIAAWRRGERSIPANEQLKLDELRKAIDETIEAYRAERESRG